MLKLTKRYLSRRTEEMWIGNRYQFLNLLEANNQLQVLDVGCGDGSFTRMIADHIGTEHISGMEINPEIARQSREINHINTIIANVSEPLPFNNGTFDVVVSNQLIEHLFDTDAFAKEVYRILRPGGVCICSTPNLASLHNIFSLILGYQPFTSHVSDQKEDCGTMFGSPFPADPNPYLGEKHRRIFTSRALKDFFELHGFRCESIVGYGFYPLPRVVCRNLRFSRYSAYITIKARKPNKV